MAKPKKEEPKRDLKQTIEDEIAAMLSVKDEPSEGRMKLLKLGIGFLAVQAKLEENEYGGFFVGDGDGATGGIPVKPAREKPATGQPKGTESEGDLGDAPLFGPSLQ